MSILSRNRSNLTICAECQHFESVEDGPRTGIWYNLYCLHPRVERKQSIDVVTGRKVFTIENDLGRVVPTDEKHPNCRDINTNGECPYYEALS